MTSRSAIDVLKTLRPVVAITLTAAAAVLLCCRPAAAQSFSGPFAGIEAGSQQVIGGSLVNGVDTLQEDSRLVLSAFAGLRAQVRGFVIGGELGIGRLDGDLVLDDPARLLMVDYRNNSQWHWQLTGGHTLGANTLLFAYLSEVSRSFAVTIAAGDESIEQRDEQGLLRYGGGVEQRLAGPLRLRVTAGTSRADFGGRPTNMTIDRRLDVGVALVFQF